MTLTEQLQAKPVWTAEQLADVLEVSAKLLYKLARQGRLPHFKIGTLVRFSGNAVAEWLQEKEVRATTGPRSV